MKERTPPSDSTTGTGFWDRWSARKQAAREEDESAAPAEEVVQQPELERPPLTDEDMPPLETLGESSDYSGFLSPEVSEGLRRLALRKLFHGSDFNVCDGLDDYAEDFTSFAKLGDLVTADMRFQMEEAARRAKSEEAAGGVEGEKAGASPADAEAGEPDEGVLAEGQVRTQDADPGSDPGGKDRLGADDKHDESESDV